MNMSNLFGKIPAFGFSNECDMIGQFKQWLPGNASYQCSVVAYCVVATLQSVFLTLSAPTLCTHSTQNIVDKHLSVF